MNSLQALSFCANQRLVRTRVARALRRPAALPIADFWYWGDEGTCALDFAAMWRGRVGTRFDGLGLWVFLPQREGCGVPLPKACPHVEARQCGRCCLGPDDVARGDDQLEGVMGQEQSLGALYARIGSKE